MPVINWVTADKLSEETGYSKKALNDKVTKGIFPQGRVWRKAPDGRRLFSKTGFNKWAESQPQS